MLKHISWFGCLALVGTLALGATGCGKKDAAPSGAGSAAPSAVAAKAAAPKSAATAHLPKGCIMVASFDLKKLRELPAFEKAARKSFDDAMKDAGKLSEVLKKEQIDLYADLDQLAMCITDIDKKDPTVLLALSGKHPKGKLVPALIEAAKQETAADATKSGFHKVDLGGATAYERDNLLLGEADDGVVLMASNAEIYKSALAPSNNAEAYKLPEGKPVFFSLQAQPLMVKFGSELRGSPLEGAKWLGQLQSIAFSLEAKPTTIELAFHMNATADMKKVDEEFQLQWAQIKGALAAEQSLPPVFKKLLLVVKVETKDNAVRAQLPISEETEKELGAFIEEAAKQH